jgi:hypothetical protein
MGYQNQIQKSSNNQFPEKLQEVLNISKAIITGGQNIGILEMQLSIDKTFEKPLMYKVFKGENEGTIAFGVVEVLINRFTESFGFSTKPNKSIIESMVIDALTKFKYETLDDLIIFLKMCRQGDFGTTHKGIDSNLVFGEWLPKYLDLKAIKREQLISIEKSKKEEELNPIEEFYKKHRREKEMRIQDENIKSEIDSMVKNMDRQMLEDTISSWEKKENLLKYLPYLKLKRKLIK